ncbi:MAG TPA: DUF222 domain-containing protein [Steroidobacteraceae bacterium]|nr:DUF222 domain-containing protein [Steroidobacteraceae bacterium]
MARLISGALPALSKTDLTSQITELAGHLNAGTYRFLLLLAEFDRREAWSDGATPSCAHWLNWQCGIDLGAAREKVRVAHALEKLPRIAQAMAGGTLSYSKVRAITRVACEATEEVFLTTALHGTASHVERLVRHYRRAKDAEELSREARQQASRGLTYFHDDDGSLVLKVRLAAEAGAVVLKAVEAAMRELPHDVSAETSEPAPTPSARRADALAAVAESFLKHGAASLSGGDRHQIVVHVDAETLRDGAAGRCELEEGPSMAAETARRLACDASIVTIVEDQNGTPLDVGRKTRSIPPALRRALQSRDRGCRFPGCSNTRYVDGHHIHHWAQGGATRLSNLVSLCRFHHRQVHEGRVLVQILDDGALRFLNPDGRSFDSVLPGRTAPLADWTQLLAAHRRHGARIDKDTAASRWRGETMDYDLALAALFSRLQRAQHVSAETCSRQVAPQPTAM